MKPFIPCSDCDKGYIYDGESALKCDCLIKYQKESLLELHLQKAGLENFTKTLQDYKGKDTQHNLDKIKLYCSNLSTTFKVDSHLYLTGVNGTQKSTIGKIIVKTAIEQGLTARFVLMSELLDLLTDVYSDNPTRAFDLECFKNADVLTIDDAFDKHKVLLYRSGYQLSFVDRFLRTRMETLHHNTVFTSNVPIAKIEENGFTKDVQNLLYRSITIFGGELLFEDVYVEEEKDINIKSLWDK